MDFRVSYLINKTRKHTSNLVYLITSMNWSKLNKKTLKPFLLHLILHIIRSFFFSLSIPILIFFWGGREGPLLRAPVKRFRNLKIKKLRLKGLSQIKESFYPNGLPKSVISGYSKTQNLPKIVSIAALITITSGNTHLGYNLNWFYTKWFSGCNSPVKRDIACYWIEEDFYTIKSTIFFNNNVVLLVEGCVKSFATPSF